MHVELDPPLCILGISYLIIWEKFQVAALLLLILTVTEPPNAVRRLRTTDRGLGIIYGLGARSIQPKFQPVRPRKLVHLKRWTRFFETFPVGPNRSIEIWTEISENFG